MTSSTKIPINLDDRVSDVIARDESLIEVLASTAPHMGALRNPIARKAMARLVTVKQAAATAGVPAAELLARLNAHIGIASDHGIEAMATPKASPATTPPPADAAVKQLDLVEDLRAGREPFAKIMAAVGKLATGEVLALRTTFEPVPLYAVLGKRGLTHHAVEHADGTWTVSFWKGETVSTQSSTPSAGSDSAAPGSRQPTGDASEIVLDVRGLEPPEPMVRTLAAIEELPAGKTLLHINVRVPQFLLPILTERGFQYQVDTSSPDRVLVRISRTAPSPT